MSTRANIIVKDNYDKLFFYRHSDGYPEGTLPTLKIFLQWVKDGKIRNNTMQAAGWLVILGALEYATIPDVKGSETSPFEGYSYRETDLSALQEPKDWKAGAYEPTNGIHGDIEYLYIIDLNKKTVECFENWDGNGLPIGSPIESIG